MKALVLKEYNKFIYTDVPDPVIGQDEVMVRIKACAICGSDVHGMDGSTGRRIPPIIMGHEASGIIEMTGAKVKNLRTGDRVTFDSTIYCRRCHYCYQGKINLCENRKVMGVSCAEYRFNGAFAEYIAVPEHILYRLPDNVSFEQAAMTEPLSVAYHAVGRIGTGKSGNAVVIGAGVIGLLIIQLLKKSRSARITVLDKIGKKLETARYFGADDTFLPDDPGMISKIMKAAGGRGTDVVFDAVGAASTVSMGIMLLGKGGTLVMVGNLSQSVTLPLQSVVTREISLFGSCASAGEYPACLKLIADGEADVGKMISAAVPLSEGAKWFDRLHSGDPDLIKVILKP